jgi:hypothetical protein
MRKNLKAHFNPTGRNFQHLGARKWLNKCPATPGIHLSLPL